MNYKEMSKFDINHKVAKLRGINFSVEFEDKPNAYIYDEVKGEEFNPHDNPNDAWPIMIENEIDITFNGSEVLSCHYRDGDEGVIQTDWMPKDKALRAAMIVFLMMNED